jgi:hypothetical protein
MVSGKQLVVRLLGRFDEAPALLQRVPDRLFHETRHAGLDAQEPLLDVHRVRRRQDHALWLVLGKAFAEGLVQRHVELQSDLRGVRSRVDDRGENAIGTRNRLFDMAYADHSCASDRNAHSCHGRLLVIRRRA